VNRLFDFDMAEKHVIIPEDLYREIAVVKAREGYSTLGEVIEDRIDLPDD
jgi:hypothetical protein